MAESKPAGKLVGSGEFDIAAEIDNVRAGVLAAPAPGTDPDSKQRLAKTLTAAGVEPPAGFTTDPVTDKAREAHTVSGDKERERLIKDAAEQRKLAAEDRGEEAKSEAPQGRTSAQDRQHTTAATKATQKT